MRDEFTTEPCGWGCVRNTVCYQSLEKQHHCYWVYLFVSQTCLNHIHSTTLTAEEILLAGASWETHGNKHLGLGSVLAGSRSDGGSRLRGSSLQSPPRRQETHQSGDVIISCAAAPPAGCGGRVHLPRLLVIPQTNSEDATASPPPPPHR